APATALHWRRHHGAVRDGGRGPKPACDAGTTRRGRRATGGGPGTDDRAPAPPLRHPGRPRLLGSCGDLREVPPRDPGRPRGVAGRALRLLALRWKPERSRRAGDRHLAVGPIT